MTGDVEPDDVKQGGLGDCWLISALSCMAEHEGIIRRAFLTKRYNPRGKYQVRIYSGFEKKWKTVTIDDFIPVKKDGMPKFAQPHYNELWVMLFEKAFAKMSGSYKSLDGGHEIWAFQALTGEPVLSLQREADNTWVRCDIVYCEPTKDEPRGIKIRTTRSDAHRDLAAFRLLHTYCRNNATMCASGASEKGGEAKHDDIGLVQGHAYAVLDMQWIKAKGEDLYLVCLRNPWGKFEWKGDWSDNSKKWDEYTECKSLLQSADASSKRVAQRVPSDDGVFWMSWADFSTHFGTVDICNRSTGIDDMRLDMNEEQNCLGPCKGCMWGCTKYWCMCHGARNLWGGRKHTGTEATLKAEKIRTDGVLTKIKKWGQR